MRLRLRSVAVLLALAGQAYGAEECLILADPETGATLLERGRCDGRVTPASTFKVALAVMGFEDGFLKDADHPLLDRKPEDREWSGGAPTLEQVTPLLWMTHSVVWYSQRIAQDLGAERLTVLARAFGYGNADFRGDPGMDNGLQRAWIGSSLKISPREQAAFLSKLVTDRLPVHPAAMASARGLVQTFDVGGWALHGKTGSAYALGPNGTRLRDDVTGWFVGWAISGGRTVVFVRLDREFEEREGSAGQRARAGLLEAWPALAAALE